MKTVSLSLVALYCLVTTANAVTFPTPTVPNCIGVAVHGPQDFTTSQDFDQLQQAGVGFVRMDFLWSDIYCDKNDGQGLTYHWDTYDNLVSNFAGRGIRVYGILCYGNDQTTSDYGSQQFRTDFTSYATQTVGHYASQSPGAVMTWELWNEPNNPDLPGQLNRDMSADTYMALANQVLPAIHQADPTTTVVAPATVPTVNTGGWPGYQAYMTACFNYGINHPGGKGLLDTNMADGVSVHLYRGEIPETVVTTAGTPWDSSYARIRGWMPSGGQKPIISGEWAYSVGDPGTDGLGNAITITPQLQGDYLQRMMLINVSQGIPLSVWYDFKNDSAGSDRESSFGLLKHDGTPKPAFYAMQTLTSNLAGKTYNAGASVNDGHSQDYILAFQNDAGRKTYAAWTTGSPVIRTIAGLSPSCQYYLTDTPMYLGEVQQRQSGNTWSTMTWSNTTGGGAGSWVAGSQAKFTSSGTYTVDASVSFSGLQFLNTSGTVTLNSSGSGALVLSSGGGALHTGARAVTINAPITGGGNSADTCEFAKTGSSTLTLGGNNTFSGNLIIAQGALKATNANALAGPVVTLNNSNSLTFGTGINNFNIGGLAGSGNLALTNVSTLTVGGNSFTTGYSGILSGSASVVKQGTGDWILSGANTYSGATTINGGSIVMGNDQALGNNTASTITLAGGALALNGSNLYGHQLNIASSQSTLANWNTGTTSVCSPNSVTVGSDFVVCGTGNIDVYGSFSASQKRTVTKGSSGVLTLSGNTDNAHLSVYARGGTVQLNKQPSSNSPDVHAVAWIDGIDSGATVQYSGTENYQVWQGGTITLNGGTLDFNGRSQTGTTMYINADESKIVNTAAAGTTIFYSPNSITVAPSVGRFCVDATDNIDLQTSIICDNSAGVYTHLQKTGAGQVRLSGAAANTLLTVDALGGTIALNKGTADGVYATYCASAGPGGTIRYLAGGDHQIQQSGWVHMEGGTIDLYGHNQTGTDLTVMTAGSTIANSAAGTTSVYTPNTMTINADMNVNTAGNLTINGQMSGPGALTKHGNGSLTLGGSNAYRGTTTISAGTLRLSGSGRIVSSSGITLNSGGTLLQDNGANSLDRTITLSGGTLGGTATYSFPTSNGTLTVGNSSHLSPGDPTIDGGNGYGIGTFTLAGAGAWTLGMNSSTVLDYDFGTAAGVSDLLQVSGGTSRSVILDGVLNISGSSVLAGRYAIISGATGIDDHGLSFGMVPTTHDWSYSIEKIGGTYSVVVTASPEPSTNILLAFAALCIVCWFRRSMRKIA